MKYKSEHIEALKELTNIGIGRAASVLNEMLQSHIILEIPEIKILLPSELKAELNFEDTEQLATVSLSFNGNFMGTASLVFPMDGAVELVSLLSGEEPGSPDLDSVRAATLSEVGNIMLNCIMGSISNILSAHLFYDIPYYSEETVDTFYFSQASETDNVLILAKTRFVIQQLDIIGNIFMLIEMHAFDRIIDCLERLSVEAG